MVTDLVYLFMGVLLMGMVLAAILVQSRMSQRDEEEAEPVEEEKIYVDLGFEESEEEPASDETEVGSEPGSIELDEPKETFYDVEYEPEAALVLDSHEVNIDEVTPISMVSYEASEPVVIDSPDAIIEPAEPAPLFEATYEASEPVVIETPQIVFDEAEESSEDEYEEAPMFDVQYEESPPVVIETDSFIFEEEAPEVEKVLEAPPEEIELVPEIEEPLEEAVVEPEEITIEEEPEEIAADPEVEEVLEEQPVVPEQEKEVEETPEPIPEEPELVEDPVIEEEHIIDSVGGKERKPIRDENDPEVNMDMGVKTCINCSSEVPDTRYCIYCGKPIDEKVEE